MKQGLSLTELAAQLEQAKKQQRDFVAPATLMGVQANPNGSGVTFRLQGHETNYSVRPHAHNQLASLTSIPREYYGRMLAEAPNLLAQNLNTWLAMRTDNKQLVRTQGNDVRAVLSDRYRPLDNVNFAEVALPELVNKGARIESCQITETRLYIKAVLPTMRRTINGSQMRDLATHEEIPDHDARIRENERRGWKIGDAVEAMLCLSNSEVGSGGLRVESGVNRVACLNAMLSPDGSFKKYHLGKQLGDAQDAVYALLTDETRRADDKALWLKIRDVVRASFDEVRFNSVCDRLENATKDKIEGKSIEKVVERVVEQFSIGDATGGSILKRLIEGGDLSRYGMVQAITAASQGVEDYDQATDLERIGGQLIELKHEDWSRLAA